MISLGSVTWHTPRGERVLNPAEAKLFASAVATMLDEYKFNGSEGLNWGVRLTFGPFEDLTSPQKVAILERVTQALITETPVPRINAVHANAIYYVYCWIKKLFDIIKVGEEVWGQMVLDALGRSGHRKSKQDLDGSNEGESSDGNGEDCDEKFLGPFIGCHNSQKWEGAVEELSDRILFDHDFDFAHLAPLPPGWMAFMDIDEDYFTKPEIGHCRGAGDRLLAFCLPFCT